VKTSTLVLSAVMATAVAAPALAQFGPGMGGDFRADAAMTDSFEIQSSQLALQKSRNPRVKAFAREAIRDHQASLAAIGGGGGYAEGPAGVGGLVAAPFQVAGAAVGAGVGTATGAVGGALTGGPVGAVQGAGSGFAAGAQRGADVGATAGVGLAPLGPEQQAMIDELRAAPAGAPFDRLYGQFQLQGHQKAVAQYQAYAQGGANPGLRNYANQALPTLQHHLAMAQRLPGAR
jgi:predicted outer membrane protein